MSPQILKEGEGTKGEVLGGGGRHGVEGRGGGERDGAGGGIRLLGMAEPRGPA